MKVTTHKIRRVMYVFIWVKFISPSFRQSEGDKMAGAVSSSIESKDN